MTRTAFSAPSFFDNDRTRQQGRYLRGQKSGVWISYYNSGKVLSQEPYEDGRRSGVVKEFFENGSLTNEICYRCQTTCPKDKAHGEPCFEVKNKPS